MSYPTCAPCAIRYVSTLEALCAVLGCLEPRGSAGACAQMMAGFRQLVALQQGFITSGVRARGGGAQRVWPHPSPARSFPVPRPCLTRS